jgi:hypothetical protein
VSGRDLYAWVTEMPGGRWVLVGFYGIEGAHTPLVSHDRALLEEMRDVAVAHGRQYRQRVQLVRWRDIEVLEGVDP